MISSRRKIIVFTAAILIFIVLFASMLLLRNSSTYNAKTNNDACTAEDIKMNNCTPAGKCGPTPEIDAIVDCQPKSYDSKYKMQQ